jgi:hypothetical protein
MRMTASEFLRRRAWGQIDPETPCRTLVFRFAGSPHEWEEIILPGRYEDIATQERDFRRAMEPAVFLDSFRPDATVKAKDWRAL